MSIIPSGTEHVGAAPKLLVLLAGLLLAVCMGKPVPVSPRPVGTAFAPGAGAAAGAGGAAGVGAGAGSVRPAAPAIVLPLQGLYESCQPSHTGCMENLSEMAGKGFRLVLNDGLRYVISAKELRAYADRAEQLGVKVILPVKYSPEWDSDNAYLPRQFPELAHECGCTDNASFLTYYVGILKDHPALWGYYMADEVHSDHHAGMQPYADLVKRLDPNHERLIVEEGTNDPMEIFFTFNSYMNDTTDVLGVDNYPYGYIDTYGDLTRYTGDSARMNEYWSGALNLKNAVVLQAFAWPQYYTGANMLCVIWPACAPFPSYEQMKAQRDQALLNANPEMILWFSYPDLLKSDDPAQHWQDLTAAAFAPLPAPVPGPTSRPQVCPPGWRCEDIGNPKLEGTQSASGGIWTVEGAGWDIWSEAWIKADQFRYIWQSLPKDGEISARVISQTDTNYLARAGLMLRCTIDPVSPYYAAFGTPGVGIQVQYRSDFNADPVVLASAIKTQPAYLKIMRIGTSYSAYSSTDGNQWTLIPGSTVKLSALAGPLLTGLAVGSRNEHALSVAQFGDVELTQHDGAYLPLVLRESG